MARSVKTQKQRRAIGASNPLSLNRSVEGGDDPSPIVPPEERAAVSRGQVLTGRIRLDQYEVLVESGYDGEVVMRWTEHRAELVIRERNLRPKSTSVLIEQPSPQLITCKICGVKLALKNSRRHLRRVHKIDDPG